MFFKFVSAKSPRKETPLVFNKIGRYNKSSPKFCFLKIHSSAPAYTEVTFFIVSIIYESISSVRPGYTPIQNELFITLSVTDSSPATLKPVLAILIHQNMAVSLCCLQTACGSVYHLISRLRTIFSRIKPAFSLTVRRKPNQLGSESGSGSGNIKQSESPESPSLSVASFFPCAQQTLAAFSTEPIR